MSQRVLVTGASSGIGRALAARLAAGGPVLATGGRTRNLLEPGLPANVHYIQADQNRPDQARHIIDGALDRFGWTGLDLAVLNAGTGFAGAPPAESDETIARILEVNLVSAILFAQALAGRLESGGGKLVLIGSTAHRGAPGFATYAASKAGLHGLARALREEWRGRIRVQIIHPGPTVTAMHARAGHEPGRAGRWFFRPETMARLIHGAMRSDRSPVTASYARYLTRGGFAGMSR